MVVSVTFSGGSCRPTCARLPRVTRSLPESEKTLQALFQNQSSQFPTRTLEGKVALLLKGSGVEKGSTFVVFLKKSSDDALKGSGSLKGSPPNGSAAGAALVTEGSALSSGLSEVDVVSLLTGGPPPAIVTYKCPTLLDRVRMNYWVTEQMNLHCEFTTLTR